VEASSALQSVHLSLSIRN